MMKVPYVVGVKTKNAHILKQNFQPGCYCKVLFYFTCLRCLYMLSMYNSKGGKLVCIMYKLASLTVILLHSQLINSIFITCPHVACRRRMTNLLMQSHENIFFRSASSSASLSFIIINNKITIIKNKQ